MSWGWRPGRRRPRAWSASGRSSGHRAGRRPSPSRRRPRPAQRWWGRRGGCRRWSLWAANPPRLGRNRGSPGVLWSMSRYRVVYNRRIAPPGGAASAASSVFPPAWTTTRARGRPRGFPPHISTDLGVANGVYSLESLTWAAVCLLRFGAIALSGPNVAAEARGRGEGWAWARARGARVGETAVGGLDAKRQPFVLSGPTPARMDSERGWVRRRRKPKGPIGECAGETPETRWRRERHIRYCAGSGAGRGFRARGRAGPGAPSHGHGSGWLAKGPTRSTRMCGAGGVPLRALMPRRGASF